MKIKLLLFLGLISMAEIYAQDPNPDDWLFETEWYSWYFWIDGEFMERPTPNDEQAFIPMNIGFADPAPMSTTACGTASLNINFIEYGHDLGIMLINDVTIDPLACELAANNSYSEVYFNALLNLEGQEVTYDIAISTPSGPEGPIALTFNLDNDNLMIWANIPLTVNDLEQVALRLYPNPATDLLQWNMEQSTDAQVYSTDGRLVLEVKQCVGQLDVSELIAGTYFLVLQTDNRRSVKPFVKR